MGGWNRSKLLLAGVWWVDQIKANSKELLFILKF